MNDDQLSFFMPEVVKMCCNTEQTYFYSQVLLSQLISKQEKAYNLRKIVQQLRDAAIEKEHNLVIKIQLLLDSELDKYSGTSEGLSNIFLAKKTNFADISKIEKEYTLYSPPPSFLRDPTFLNLLINELFDPKTNIHPKNVPKYLFLLAYASIWTLEEQVEGGEEGEKREKEKREKEKRERVKETVEALQNAFEICKKNLFGLELQKALPLLSSNLQKHTIVCKGVIKWIEVSLTQTESSSSISLSLPYLLLLLRFIFFHHPLLRPQLLHITQEAFEQERSSMDALASINFRKKLLKTLLYFLRCGHVLPVLSSVERLSQKHDPSLIRFFLSMLLQIIQPPFSPPFLHKLFLLLSLSFPSDPLSLKKWHEEVSPFLLLIPSSSLLLSTPPNLTSPPPPTDNPNLTNTPPPTTNSPLNPSTFPTNTLSQLYNHILSSFSSPSSSSLPQSK